MARRLEEIAARFAIGGGLILLAIMLVSSLNAGAFALDRAARLFGGAVSGLSGYEDFVLLAISSAALMFFPYCQAKRGHVAVDLFVSMLPPRARRWLDVFWLAMTLVLTRFLFYWMWLGMLETREDGVLSSIIGWPIWPFYLPGIASILLWELVTVAQILAPAPERPDADEEGEDVLA